MKADEDKNFEFFFGDVPDGILLIEDNIFHVQSDKLIEHSEYFRVMFTSNFKEKDEKQIEIGVVKSIDARIFMRAVYDPKHFNCQSEDLELLIKMCAFFQANDYLVNMFEEKPMVWINQLTTELIINLSVEQGIPELKDIVEAFVIANFQIEPMRYEYYLRKYLGGDNNHQLSKLKGEIEQFLLLNLKKVKVCDVYACIKLLENCTSYNMDSLKASIEDYLMLKGIEEEGIIKDYCNKIKTYIVRTQVWETDTFVFRYFVTYPIDEICNILIAIDTSGTIKFKELLENLLIAEFTLFTENENCEERLKHLLKFTEYLPTYKDVFEQCYINQFEQYKNNIQFEKYSEDIQLCQEYKLHEFKAFIESYLVSEYKKKADRKLELDDDDIVKLAFLMKLETISNFLQNDFIAEFELDKSNLQKFETLLITYNMPLLKKAIESFFIADFVSTHDFKYIQFAFKKYGDSDRSTYLFSGFEDTVRVFLSTAHLEDPVIQNARDHILALSVEAKIAVFECLFRKLEKPNE